MGAAADRPRNDQAERGTVGKTGASMGPRPIGRGMVASQEQGGNGVHASMGPRPIGRGMAVLVHIAR